MKLSLVVMTDGNNRGKVLDITLAQFIVGRDPQCHLRPASCDNQQASLCHPATR